MASRNSAPRFGHSRWGGRRSTEPAGLTVRGAGEPIEQLRAEPLGRSHHPTCRGRSSDEADAASLWRQHAGRPTARHTGWQSIGKAEITSGHCRTGFSVTAAMPRHRPGQFALITCGPGHPAVPLGHALLEHEFGCHPRHRGGVVPADLLYRGRIVIGLAGPLRKRGRTCAQQDARCENGSVISASIAPTHVISL